MRPWTASKLPATITRLQGAVRTHILQALSTPGPVACCIWLGYFGIRAACGAT
jgi:hypothetical protein